MKIKSDFIIQKMTEASYVAMPTGSSKNLVNGYLNVNSTGAFLWNILKDGATKQELINALIKNYEVDVELAKKDVDAFILKLTEIGALDD
ncbi:MAG: PqqD family protein [Clostridia bacterium]|nr:PqqD family protein [Clostridia bacterium]